MLVAVEDNTVQCDLSTSGWSESPNQCEENLSIATRKEMERLLQQLPRNLNIEKERRKQSTAADLSQSNLPLDALQEGNEEEDLDETVEENLKIAWQYKKEVQKERQGGVSGTSAGDDSARAMEAANDTFCHSFDLQGLLSEQIKIMQSCRIVDVSDAADAFDYFRKLSSFLPMHHDHVTRLLFYEPRVSFLRIALPLLLSVIREKKLPIVLLVVVKPWLVTEVSFLVSCETRTADVVLQTEGFASRKIYPPPPEFRMFQGLLRIPKASTVTACTAHGGGHFAELTTTKRPASDMYGLKRDRRKLHIQLLHIPPEDYAQGGGSVGGGGVRSGAGRSDKPAGLGCASSGGDTSLDF